MNYPRCGWTDGQIGQLGALLEEARCPRVAVLKLTMHKMTSGRRRNLSPWSFVVRC